MTKKNPLIFSFVCKKMGRGYTTLNDIGASGEPQQRSGESVPTFLSRTEGGGSGAKHSVPPKDEEEEFHDPLLSRNMRRRTESGPPSQGNSQALLLALLLGCAIFISLYTRRS